MPWSAKSLLEESAERSKGRWRNASTGLIHGQVFDNLLDVDDRGIQALLREVGSDTLAVALRGAEPEVQEKDHNNKSKRAAEILKEDM